MNKYRAPEKSPAEPKQPSMQDFAAADRAARLEKIKQQDARIAANREKRVRH
jgi:hypothetical protein